MFLFSSCEKKEHAIRFRINQFKQPATTPERVMALSVQEGSAIGSNEWRPLHNTIAGLNYEPGYIYEVLVSETEIMNPPPGTSHVGYRLLEVLSKTPVNQPFEIKLKVDNKIFVDGNSSMGFNLLNEAHIDCGSLCDDLSQAVSTDPASIVGKFTLNADGSIKLIELKVN
ncbi:MAG: DUF4377 domain-containing protein [Pedobacter sp.]|nr:DUF4377 domain-containing protein [Pedobacter sp.]MDQ8051375.1 DUF4377 domain-containing protein [Pedobacter sp.]